MPAVLVPRLYQVVPAVPRLYQVMPAVPRLYQVMPAVLVPRLYHVVPALPRLHQVVPASARLYQPVAAFLHLHQPLRVVPAYDSVHASVPARGSQVVSVSRGAHARGQSTWFRATWFLRHMEPIVRYPGCGGVFCTHSTQRSHERAGSNARRAHLRHARFQVRFPLPARGRGASTPTWCCILKAVTHGDWASCTSFNRDESTSFASWGTPRN
jgi:hypothetical protein